MVEPAPRRTLSEQKRAAILAAAVALFAELGFDAVSMDSIAEHAQVSKRTVYKHFLSKDELFHAIVDDLKLNSRSVGGIPYEPERSLADQLSGFGRKVIEFHRCVQSRQLGRVIVSRLLQVPRLSRELFGGAKIFEVELSKWLAAARQAGRLCPLDERFAAKQFLGLLESFVVWPTLLKLGNEPAAAELDRYLAETVAMFLARYQQ